MEMEINMKEVGKIIQEMAKELIGYRREKIDLEENIQETGKTIKKLVEVLCFIKMEIDMMDSGLMINLTVKAE
jgi:hypothetical protein